MAQRLSSQMQNPKGMGESTGFRSMEGEMGRSELANASQSLKGSSVDQIDRQGFGGTAPMELDGAVKRIVVSPLSRAHAFVSPLSNCSTNNR
jgi:hypothetical protein